MTPTLVLVLTYFSVAICAVIGEALMRIPRLFNSVARHFMRQGRGRHQTFGAAARAEARP